MEGVALYVQVWRAIFIEGMSRRETARLIGARSTRCCGIRCPQAIGARSLRRARSSIRLSASSTGFSRKTVSARNKQRHTPKWIFERLRDEHGFTGGITIVKDYVFAARQRRREMYVPLCHGPGGLR